MRPLMLVLMVLGSLACAKEVEYNTAKELADTERAFSKYSEENGMFKAFVKYCAEDGIQFAPIPFNTHYEFAPELSKPKPEFTLSWFPTYTKVAAAGDLGFEIGPWTITDQSAKKRDPRYGYFFSVWRKLPEGWRVIVDSGVRTASRSAETPDSWKNEPPPNTGKTVPAAQPDELYSQDRRFSRTSESSGLESAFDKFLSAGFVVLRETVLPIRDRASLTRALADTKNFSGVSYIPMRCEVARSNDLGYCVGALSSIPKDEKAETRRGFYVHVWERNVQGEWKLVIDTERDEARK